MAFTGFPADGLEFLAGLEADNTKAYWVANKAVYDRALKGPMEMLLAELDARYQPLRMFRPNRDVRFSKDKSPYKTNVAAAGEREGGSVYYLQLTATGLMTGSGAYMLATDQLARFRAAVADEGKGAAFLELVRHYESSKGMQLTSGGEAPLKTAPKGYAKDHPRIDLLRWKGATVFCEFGDPRGCTRPRRRRRLNRAGRRVSRSTSGSTATSVRVSSPPMNVADAGTALQNNRARA